MTQTSMTYADQWSAFDVACFGLSYQANTLEQAIQNAEKRIAYTESQDRTSVSSNALREARDVIGEARGTLKGARGKLARARQMTNEAFRASNGTNVPFPGSMMITAMDLMSGVEERLSVEVDRVRELLE